MPLYDDIYMRDNFGDSGITPSTGVPYQSPDIIPFQTGLLDWSTVTSSYANGPDLGMPIVAPGLNNIYMRGFNLQPAGTASGVAQLFYAPASLLLLPPQWGSVQTGTGGGSVQFINQAGSSQLNPNDICLGSEAFVLTNLPPAQNDHYCFIGLVNTARHPISVPTSFASNAAFAWWVQSNPAVAWRNIAVVDNPVNQIVSSYVFGSTSSSQAYYHFRVSAPEGHNFAAGTEVMVQCTDPRAPIDWSGVLPPPDPNGNQITGFDAAMPGNFTASLTATATSKGAPFPAGARLSVSYYQYPSSLGDPLEQMVARPYAITREGLGATRVPIAASLILLGECSVYVETLQRQRA